MKRMFSFVNDMGLHGSETSSAHQISHQGASRYIYLLTVNISQFEAVLHNMT